MSLFHSQDGNPPRNASIRGWMPADLNQPTSVENPAAGFNAEALRAIFQPLEGEAAERFARQGVLKQPACDHIRVWSPAGITELKPTAARPTEHVGPHIEDHQALRQPDLRAAAETDARRILQQAEESARKILIEADLRKEEVLRQGYADGQTEAYREMALSLQAASQVVEQINDWWQEMIAQGEPMVIELIKDTAQFVFGTGMEVPAEVLEKNFQQALQKARSLGDLKVFVHPADIEQLSQPWREMQVSLLDCEVRLIPDEQVLRGGCFIEGQLGAVDARVQTRIAAVHDSLDSLKRSVEKSVL